MPANFEGHKFSKTSSHMLLEAGFHVGDVVVLKARITVEFGEKKTRADVNKGTQTSIKGVTEAGLAVVSFAKTIGKTEHRADYAIKLSNIILASEKKVKDVAKTALEQGAGAQAGHAFLDKAPTQSELVVCKKWEGNQTMNSQKIQNAYFTGTMAYFMHRLMSTLPVYADNDFIICKRDGAYEVWTNKVFKANTIITGRARPSIKIDSGPKVGQ